MKIKKFLPSIPLRNFIKELTIIESEFEFNSTIIPNTSMVMAFRLRGKVLNRDQITEQAIPSNMVSGLRKSPRLLQYKSGASNLLVVFKEGGLAAFTQIPAHELFGQSIPLENLFDAAELAEISERLSECAGDVGRISIIEDFFQKKLIDRNPDYLVRDAVQVIQRKMGIVRITDLSSSLHISQDPFEKRFRALVGCTPKHYASIIRLRNLIKTYPSATSLTEVSYKAGYFDQSHFIKDFRLFTGHSPKDFFSSVRYW